MAQPQPAKSDCATCEDSGWVCAGTGKPADFDSGACCEPGMSEYGPLGPGCPSADGCPDCDEALRSHFVLCRDCGAPTTVTMLVLKAHSGDYVLCPTCTTRTTVDP